MAAAVQLGPIAAEHPFILAPMAGITGSPFRRLMRRLGSSLVVSELVSANGLEYASDKTMDLLRYDPEERPVGLQIFGEDTERLCNAARKIEKLGADFVDLNMGCPVPKVVKKGGGSAMCRDLPALAKTLQAMVEAVKIPVTIKIRTGWDESSRNALEVVRLAADVGVAWVAIHGRTRAQGYSGLADWDFMGDIKAKASLPIIANGDITTPEGAIQKVRTYGVDAVMIGRAALRNPFIFEQARALWQGATPPAATPERHLALVEELVRLFREFYPPRAGRKSAPEYSPAMIHARKFLAWFSSGYPGCHEFRRKVFSITDEELLWEESRRFFLENTRTRDLRFLADPFLMGGHG